MDNLQSLRSSLLELTDSRSFCVERRQRAAQYAAQTAALNAAQAASKALSSSTFAIAVASAAAHKKYRLQQQQSYCEEGHNLRDYNGRGATKEIFREDIFNCIQTSTNTCPARSMERQKPAIRNIQNLTQSKQSLVASSAKVPEDENVNIHYCKKSSSQLNVLKLPLPRYFKIPRSRRVKTGWSKVTSNGLLSQESVLTTIESTAVDDSLFLCTYAPCSRKSLKTSNFDLLARCKASSMLPIIVGFERRQGERRTVSPSSSPRQVSHVSFLLVCFNFSKAKLQLIRFDSSKYKRSGNILKSAPIPGNTCSTNNFHDIIISPRSNTHSGSSTICVYVNGLHILENVPLQKFDAIGAVGIAAAAQSLVQCTKFEVCKVIVKKAAWGKKRSGSKNQVERFDPKLPRKSYANRWVRKETEISDRRASQRRRTGEREREIERKREFGGGLRDVIESEIISRNLGVKFDDIAGLSPAKELLNEAVVLPLLVPEFFTGIRKPWKGVLLFGPPGTGKTMLAKATAGVAGSTFFNVSVSTLVTKWRGESEKLVRCLFDLARQNSPSIIFIDEIDALLAKRGGEKEHEASRRLKTEFFTQMDGLNTHDEHVMVLATSNVPWDLDEALLRRLEKRIHVNLPCQAARKEMIRLNLKDVQNDLSEKQLERISKDLAGFSGSDIFSLCREACMGPVRKILKYNLSKMKINELDAVVEMDFKQAMQKIKASITEGNVAKFSKWEKEFASN
eukprot:g5432.t1